MTPGVKPREFYRDAYGYHPIFALSSFVDAGEVAALLGNDEIKDSHIDWGTGAGQVSAADVPIADAGTRFTGTEVETALQELAGSGRTTETVKANADEIAAKGVPTGAMMMWGTASPPTGWLICDGTAISETTYAGLFAVIGHGFGGDPGGGNFYLPNFKGLSPTGVGAQDINARTKTGPALGVVREDQFQKFQLRLKAANNTAITNLAYPPTSARTNANVTADDVVDAFTTDGVGGLPRTGAYTHGPEIGVHFIIKT